MYNYNVRQNNRLFKERKLFPITNQCKRVTPTVVLGQGFNQINTG